jgi:hypothetical protein
MKSLGQWIVLWAGLGLAACGWGRINVDLSQDPEFAHIVGKQFRTKVKLLVYKNSGERNIFIGEIGDAPSLPTQEEMKANFPFRYYNKKILGILPAGSEFKVVKVMLEGPKGWAYTDYYANIIRSEDPQWVGKIVCLEIITTDWVPQFEEGIVEEIEARP